MSKTYRVLVVEDDDVNYKLVCTILRKYPLEMLPAVNGAEAIAFLQKEIPDLILLDINLPDMRGWDILDYFKNDERFAQARVIVLTAHNEPVHRMIGSLQKAVAVYLNKPVEPNELRSQVKQLLQIRA